MSNETIRPFPRAVPAPAADLVIEHLSWTSTADLDDEMTFQTFCAPTPAGGAAIDGTRVLAA